MYQTQAQAAAGGASEGAPEGASSAAEFKRLLLKYAGENPVKLLSVAALSYGGMLLLLYFCRIGFMPELNLESATSLLYAVAMLGMFIVFFAMFTFVAPGLLLGFFRDGESPWLKHAGDVILSMSWASICWGVVLAQLFGVADSASGCLLFVAAMTLCAVIGVAVGWMVPRAKCLRVRQRAVVAAKDSATQAEETASISWLQSAFLAMLCFGTMSMPLLFIFLLGREGDLASSADQVAFGAVALQMAGVAAAGIFLGCAAPHLRLGLAVVLASLLFLAISAGTGAFTVVPAIVVRKLGVGEMQAARLVLTAKGCRALNAAAAQRVCQDAGPGDEEALAVCPVVLRSTIGTQLVVEFGTGAAAWGAWLHGADKSAQRNHVRVVLDKAQLLAWSPIEVPKLSEVSSDRQNAADAARQAEARQVELDRVCGAGSGLLVHARAADLAGSAPSAAASRP